MSFPNDFWFWIAALAALAGIYYAMRRRGRPNATSLSGQERVHTHHAVPLANANEPPLATKSSAHMTTRDAAMRRPHDDSGSGGRHQHGCC